MEPIPESARAADELEVPAHDDDLLDQLRRQAARVVAVAPGCVGMSVTTFDDDVTLTLVATPSEMATLDAAQLHDGVPRTAAVDTGVALSPDLTLLDEGRWQLFAQVSAARGVRSTLSMPVLGPTGSVVGGVTLYGAATTTFDGLHEDLALVCHAWAGGAVANADLAFDSRRRARAAPEELRERVRIDTAVGVLAHALGIPVEVARTRLREAAASAGTSPSVTARALLVALDRG